LHFGVLEHVAIESDETRIGIARRNVEMVKTPDQVFRLIEGSSDIWLPKLAGGNKFDLMLIDGGHRFDDVFIDVHYARMLVRQGGVMLLDDGWMESVKAVVRWVETNLPHLWERLEPPADLVAGRNFTMAAFSFKPADGGDDLERAWDFHRAF
jgi:16S rRNA G966 N2-methylase RsmD